MAFNPPLNPTSGDEYPFGDLTYVFNGTYWALKVSEPYLLKSNNLSDLPDAGVARASIGLVNHELLSVTAGGNLSGITSLDIDGPIGLGTDGTHDIGTPLVAARDIYLTGTVQNLDEVWQPLTFSGTWTDYGSPYALAACRRMPDGRVVVKGFVKNANSSGGALNQSIAVIPDGYRPSEIHRKVCANKGGDAFLEVTLGGSIVIRDHALSSTDHLALEFDFYQ